MSWKLNILAIAAAALLPFAFAACEQHGSHNKAASGSIASVSEVGDASSAPAAKTSTDQELIDRQKTCPVSGEPLGSMGEPVKVVVKGRTVFLCCAGCTKKLMADPDKYLRKLDEKK